MTRSSKKKQQITAQEVTATAAVEEKGAIAVNTEQATGQISVIDSVKPQLDDSLFEKSLVISLHASPTSTAAGSPLTSYSDNASLATDKCSVSFQSAMATPEVNVASPLFVNVNHHQVLSTESATMNEITVTKSPTEDKIELKNNLYTPSPQQKIIAELETLHQEKKKIENIKTVEITEINAKYDRLFGEVYKSRAKILQQHSTSHKENDGDCTLIEKTPSAIPGFWLQSLINHQILGLLIEKKDEIALQYLQDISFQWENEMERRSFTLVFQFAENPFFTPLTLMKTFNLQRDEDFGTDILYSTRSTKLAWKDGMDITVTKIIRKQRNVRTNETRTVTEFRKGRTFFNLFEDSDLPSEDLLEEMDEAEIKRIQVRLASELEAGITIRDTIIPDAISWYLGNLRVALSSSETESDDETAKISSPVNAISKTFWNLFT
ncbi:nucleosome assembly protein (nap) protein [Cardiosporidium cionae]|uniref:Nucleosome assembly protein (Nap) protein n=1 Tax=Cardiosporidium cionae TaxID=476202 RepID=A0ABQ7JEW0_9APIC|nr:nucleosome assembly protein (nap) protein [Cardiosporidium cionae]|eukprot:KAF8822538.1 nucleosome assembly protein (nap) protein [Cardiosporidium cionae]